MNIYNDSSGYIRSVFQFIIDHIAHGYRIGTLNPLHSKFTLDAALQKMIIFCFNGIPTTGRFIDDSYHSN